MMTTRDDLFRKFGPLLIEGIPLALLEYINALRDNQGLRKITYDQLIDDIANHLSHLHDYPWMHEPDSLDEQPLPDKILQTQPLPKPKSFITAIYSKLKALNPFSRR